MSCLDEQSFDLKNPQELQKAIGTHRWSLEHYDQFGENGVIARYRCVTCGKEWTNLLLNPAKGRKRI
ncbi:MAG: hypothetical protein JRN67_10325 [Nitrososphaerota archaeon]|nr:hypothetical protein [Nitrososphaerota archaeon]